MMRIREQNLSQQPVDRTSEKVRKRHPLPVCPFGWYSTRRFGIEICLQLPTAECV